MEEWSERTYQTLPPKECWSKVATSTECHERCEDCDLPNGDDENVSYGFERDKMGVLIDNIKIRIRTEGPNGRQRPNVLVHFR